MNAIPSPLAADGLIYCMSGYRKPIIYAIPYDARGDISGAARARSEAMEEFSALPTGHPLRRSLVAAMERAPSDGPHAP